MCVRFDGVNYFVFPAYPYNLLCFDGKDATIVAHANVEQLTCCRLDARRPSTGEDSGGRDSITANSGSCSCVCFYLFHRTTSSEGLMSTGWRL